MKQYLLPFKIISLCCPITAYHLYRRNHAISKFPDYFLNHLYISFFYLHQMHPSRLTNPLKENPNPIPFTELHNASPECKPGTYKLHQMQLKKICLLLPLAQSRQLEANRDQEGDCGQDGGHGEDGFQRHGVCVDDLFAVERRELLNGLDGLADF